MRNYINGRKTNENDRMDGNIHVCYDVCILYPTIMDNLAGHKGNFIQPLVAVINCSLWVYYGLFKKERDLPLAAANAPGIVFGLITVLTAMF